MNLRKLTRGAIVPEELTFPNIHLRFISLHENDLGCKYGWD